MMILATVVITYLVITAMIILAVCALSARMSQREDWSETPMVDNRAEMNTARDYQTDAATSS